MQKRLSFFQQKISVYLVKSHYTLIISVLGNMQTEQTQFRYYQTLIRVYDVFILSTTELKKKSLEIPKIKKCTHSNEKDGCIVVLRPR